MNNSLQKVFLAKKKTISHSNWSTSRVSWKSRLREEKIFSDLVLVGNLENITSTCDDQIFTYFDVIFHRVRIQVKT